MKINGVILAAGLSSRMEDFKPLLKLKEKTMIEHSIDSMFQAEVNQVVLVLGHRAEEIKAVLCNRYDPSRLKFTYNEKYAETDMLTSIKIGISALNSCDGFYLLPGDMPAIHTKTFLAVRAMMVKSRALVTFPTIEGHRKHPPLISNRCIEYILKFHGQGGLRELWKRFEEEIKTVPVEDDGCMMDADTKEDYNRLLHYMGEIST